MKEKNQRSERGLIRDMWSHAVLSFVILLLNTNGKKRVISKDTDGAYYANIPGGILPFDGACTLYSAFCWFHSHLEEYESLLTEAYDMYGRPYSLMHHYPIDLPLYEMAAILDFPKACNQKRYGISPLEFTKLLFKAFKEFAPDLYYLNLQADIFFKKALLKDRK